MFKMLKKTRFTSTEIKLLYQLYENEVAIIKKEDIQKQSKIEKGFRQGCTLSSLIINAYIQEAIDTILDRTQLEIKVS